MSEMLDRYEAMLAARSEFFWTIAAGVALPVAIHFASPSSFSPTMRLLLTAAFFLALSTIGWAFTGPLKAYVLASWRFRVEDAGPAIETAAQGLALDIARLGAGIGQILMALTVLTGLRVLSQWPQFGFLGAASPILALLWWGALAALGLFILTSTNRITEIVVQKRAIERQMLARGFTQRSVQDAEARRQDSGHSAPMVTAPLSFRVGGSDWHWDDFKPNAIVFGQPGSGKTVTVLNAMLDGLLTSASAPWSELSTSGLILDPKGDYRDKIRGVMRRLGREGDLLVLDPEAPGESIRWNPFDSPDDELELADRFGAVMAMLGQKAGDDSFFVDSSKLFMRHAIALLRATNPNGEPPSFADINDLASSPDRLRARMFLAMGLLCTRLLGEDGPDQLGRIAFLASDDPPVREAIGRLGSDKKSNELRRALREYVDGQHGSDKNRAEHALTLLLSRFKDQHGELRFRDDVDALDACDYFANGWLRLADRTQSGIQAQLTNMVDPFLMEPYRTMLSGKSTASVEQVLREGKILYVHMPVARRERMSRTLNTLIKLEFQRQILMAPDKRRPSLFLCDEFQAFFTSDEGRGDASFFERSRQSNHVNLIATQNLNALLRATPKEQTVHNLLGNCAVKIFLRNNDPATNKYASEIFGQYQEIVVGRSGSIAGSGGRQGFGLAAGITEQSQASARLRPDEFTTLRIPSRSEAVPFSEAWIRVGSRPTIEDVKLRFPVYPLDTANDGKSG